MRLLDREILRCEGKIPQLAPSAQLRGKLLYNVSLRASESSECFGDSEGARLGNTTFLELTFPNSGCSSAATSVLFRSEIRVNFAFWLEAWSKTMERCTALWLD